MTSRTRSEPALDLGRFDPLRARIRELADRSGARALAVAVYDAGTGSAFRYDAERWFHAASTIKIAILLGVFSAVHRGRLSPHARLHVRNRFISAFDGEPFRVDAARDADDDVHAAVGRMMRIDELARHMIANSSNLATNLLLDLVGLDSIHRTLGEFDLHGIDLERGVEDERAFQHGVNNLVNADGLVAMLRVIAEGRAFTPALSQAMLDILHQQQFSSGIPARLPAGARVAHKTGDISTVAHDAGIVYLPGRAPYVIVVLTEWIPGAGQRAATISAVSYAVYEQLTGGRDDDD